MMNALQAIPFKNGEGEVEGDERQRFGIGGCLAKAIFCMGV